MLLWGRSSQSAKIFSASLQGFRGVDIDVYISVFHLESLNTLKYTVIIAHVTPIPPERREKQSVVPEIPAPTHRYDYRMTTLLLPGTLSLPKDSAESIVHTNQTYDHIREHVYWSRMQMFSTYDHNWDIFQSILPGSIGL